MEAKNRSELLDRKQFPDYLIWLRKNNHSIKNISKYRDTIYTFYNYAIHLRLITANPVLRETKTTFEKQSLAYFSSAQIEAFKAARCKAQQQCMRFYWASRPRIIPNANFYGRIYDLSPVQQLL